VQTVTHEFIAQTRLDILVNNAGLWVVWRYWLTEQRRLYSWTSFRKCMGSSIHFYSFTSSVVERLFVTFGNLTGNSHFSRLARPLDKDSNGISVSFGTKFVRERSHTWSIYRWLVWKSSRYLPLHHGALSSPQEDCNFSPGCTNCHFKLNFYNLNLWIDWEGYICSCRPSRTPYLIPASNWIPLTYLTKNWVAQMISRVTWVDTVRGFQPSMAFCVMLTILDLSPLTGLSKLANLLFTKEPQKRLDSEGVQAAAVALHPGGSDWRINLQYRWLWLTARHSRIHQFRWPRQTLDAAGVAQPKGGWSYSTLCRYQ
jgi:NAD(P)-dependent dehydrogenase (short-subunit alcohol dehydrogenase family)